MGFNSLVGISVIPNDVNQTPFISGTAVNNEKFIFDSIHFHWGDTDSVGSEHSLNNVKFSGEVCIHLMHYWIELQIIWNNF